MCRVKRRPLNTNEVSCGHYRVPSKHLHPLCHFPSASQDSMWIPASSASQNNCPCLCPLYIGAWSLHLALCIPSSLSSVSSHSSMSCRLPDHTGTWVSTLVRVPVLCVVNTKPLRIPSPFNYNASQLCFARECFYCQVTKSTEQCVCVKFFSCLGEKKSCGDSSIQREEANMKPLRTLLPGKTKLECHSQKHWLPASHLPEPHGMPFLAGETSETGQRMKLTQEI